MTVFLLDLLEVAIIGLVSAILMTLVEFPFWKKWGMEGIAEWQINLVLVQKLLARFKEQDQIGLSWMIASHWLHGAIAGLTFWFILPIVSSLIPIAQVLITLDAVIYSLILWFIFLVIGRRAFESIGRIRITNLGLFSSLLSMLVYGFFLGFLLLTTF